MSYVFAIKKGWVPSTFAIPAEYGSPLQNGSIQFMVSDFFDSCGCSIRHVVTGSAFEGIENVGVIGSTDALDNDLEDDENDSEIFWTELIILQ